MKNKFPFFVISLVMMACNVQKKHATEIRQLVENQKNTELKIQDFAKQLRQETTQEVKREELLEGVARNIDSKLISALEESKSNTNLAETILLKLDSKDKKLQNEGIIESKIFLAKSGKFVDSLVVRLEVMNSLYQLPTLKVFETAAFFPTGEYTIPNQYKERIKNDFRPIFKEIVDFSNRYGSVKLAAILNTQGYADAQDFNRQSAIVKTLSERLGNPEPSRADLNLMLSQLRAKSLGDYMEEMLQEYRKSVSDANIDVVDLKWEGKGETLPNESITDYKTNDPRRRIVVIFWNVLPVEFTE